MAVSKQQHGFLTSARTALMNAIHPQKKGITVVDGPTYSTIPGVGKPFPKAQQVQGVRGTNHDFVSHLPVNQKTFGVPGAN